VTSPGASPSPRRTLAYAPDYAPGCAHESEREVLESELIEADEVGAHEGLLSALTLTLDGSATLTLDGGDARETASEVYNSGILDDRSGEVIHGRYRLLRMLGKGGMGTVYLARHTGLPKTFAIKLLHPRYASRADIASRFLQEAQAVSRIDHPNVVGVTDFGTLADGGAFLVMDHLRGESLAALCKREAPLPWPRARHIAVQMCRALAAAHAVGVLHRDIKPENLLRTTAGDDDPDYIKVLDFGLAKLQSGGGLRLTRAGMILGTPEYMSPEQACGWPTDPRTDMYASGAVLYELLCGRPPFRAKNFVEMRHQHVMVRPEPPSAHAPGQGISAQMDAVCLRALAKRPEHRFESMTAMLAAIEAVGTGAGPVPLLEDELVEDEADPDATPTVELEPQPIGPRSRAPATKLPRGAWLIAGLVFGVAMGIGATLLLTQSEPAPTQPRSHALSPRAASPSPNPARVALRITTNTPVRILDASDHSLFARGEPVDRIEVPHASTPLRLILRADGYLDAELSVTPDRDQTLTATLEPAPEPAPEPTPTPASPPPEPKPELTPEPERPPVNSELIDPWKRN
jgi:eukaryotic-like serine/threonine-protein kinase